MPITYNDLKTSHNKLAVLLYRLSYPTQNTPEYWMKWASQPLHQLVLDILRGFAEHQQRIMRLKREQDYIREQFQQVPHLLLIKEDADKIQSFLHREYLHLLKAEKREYKNLQRFINEQIKLVEKTLANQEETEQQAWQQLLRQQYKIITSELKKAGLDRELEEFKAEFADKIG